tara:strand:+ start:66020 stop:67219 length:1200 start_codon:yes stop_codon:yes gene_type:complete
MKRYKLKNGLTLLVDPRQSNAVALGILIKVGSNDEKPKERGIAHFMEHMLFEGTKTKSSQELTAVIEGVGGESNAITTNEKTFVYAVVPKKHFSRTLETLADIFINSTFLPKSFQKEKGVIHDEIKMLHDDPKAFQWILFLETLFKKNRIRLPVYGDLKIIRNLKRDALLSFYKKYYSSKNIIVSVAGNVKNIKSLVEKQFSSLNSSPVSRWKNPVEIKHTKLESKKKVHKTNQTYFLLGYKTPPAKHKDAPVLDVVRAILDRGQSSRLFDEIRSKRGLAYAVGAAHEDALTYGYFVVSVITNKKNVPRVRRVVLEQLQLPSLSQKELDEAKQYLEGSLILSNEDNLERVERNAVCEFLGRDHKKYMAALKRVSLADVRRVVKKYFHKHFTETIIEQKD